MKTAPLRHLADVWTSSVDKHTVEGEMPVQLCNYTDAYKKDRVHPGPDLMRATATPDEIRRNRLHAGDSVFTKDSEDPQDIGISAFVDGEADDFVCGYHLAIARPHRATHARFLNWALRSRPVLDHFGTYATGISRYGIGMSDLRSAPIPVVAPDAQRRIADFLDDRVSRIDRIIAARREQIDALDNVARSELAARALDGSADQMPLRYLLLDERLGLWGSEPGEDEVDVRVARVADFRRSEFSLAETPTVRSAAWGQLRPRQLRPGDVLLERSGGTQRNPVGCPAFVEQLVGHTVCSNFVSRLRPRPEVDGRYLALVLGTLYATRQQAPHSTQTTGIMNLDTGSYFQVRVPIRGHVGQVRVGREMDRALAATRGRQEQLRAAVDALTEYKASLITAAVTGELDVTTTGSNIPG